MSHLISAKQFSSTEQLDRFFAEVDFINDPRSQYRRNACNDKIMAALFYEPSTRTRFSFEAAMHRLGGAVISEGNPQMLSVAKGETLEDTIRTVSQYADMIVLRHPEKGAATRAAMVSDVPIINAGDGAGEHPTQALLDLYTIRQNFKFDGLTVLVCGDLFNGRTVHSLVTLLSLYKNVHLLCCSPDEYHPIGLNNLGLPKELVEELKGKGVEISFFKTLEEGLAERPNIVYMTRLQKERMNFSVGTWNNFCMTPKLMEYLDDNVLVMHPLPRNEELVGAVDNDPRCVYFTKQVKNGMKVRMELLYEVCRGKVCYSSI